MWQLWSDSVFAWQLSLCLSLCVPESLRERGGRGGGAGVVVVVGWWCWWGGGGVGWEVTFNSLIIVRVRAVGVVGGWDG